jgi:hypothetical protein
MVNISYEFEKCPFCASENLTLKGNDGLIGVYCSDCFALGPQSCEVESCVEEWNTRHIFDISTIEDEETNEE